MPTLQEEKFISYLHEDIELLSISSVFDAQTMLEKYICLLIESKDLDKLINLQDVLDDPSFLEGYQNIPKKYLKIIDGFYSILHQRDFLDSKVVEIIDAVTAIRRPEVEAQIQKQIEKEKSEQLQFQSYVRHSALIQKYIFHNTTSLDQFSVPAVDPQILFDWVHPFITSCVEEDVLKQIKNIINSEDSPFSTPSFEHQSFESQTVLEPQNIVFDVIRALCMLPYFVCQLDSFVDDQLHKIPRHYRRETLKSFEEQTPPIFSKKPFLREGAHYANSHGICGYLALNWLMAITGTRRNVFYARLSPERFSRIKSTQSAQTRTEAIKVFTRKLNAEDDKNFFDPSPRLWWDKLQMHPPRQVAVEQQLWDVRKQFRLGLYDNSTILELSFIPYSNCWNDYVTNVEQIPEFIFSIIDKARTQGIMHLIAYLKYIPEIQPSHAMGLSIKIFSDIVKILFYDPNLGNHIKLYLKLSDPKPACEKQRNAIQKIFSYSSATNPQLAHDGLYYFSWYRIDKLKNDSSLPSMEHSAEIFSINRTELSLTKQIAIFLNACMYIHTNIIESSLSNDSLNSYYFSARNWEGYNAIGLLCINSNYVEYLYLISQVLEEVKRKADINLFSQPLFQPTVQYQKSTKILYQKPPRYSNFELLLLPPIFLFCSNPDFLRLLNIIINCGVDVNSISFRGLSPLHVACDNNNIDAVELLLKHKAKTNQFYGGKTPRDMALDKNFTGIVTVLDLYSRVHTSMF